RLTSVDIHTWSGSRPRGSAIGSIARVLNLTSVLERDVGARPRSGDGRSAGPPAVGRQGASPPAHPPTSSLPPRRSAPCPPPGRARSGRRHPPPLRLRVASPSRLCEPARGARPAGALPPPAPNRLSPLRRRRGGTWARSRRCERAGAPHGSALRG